MRPMTKLPVILWLVIAGFGMTACEIAVSEDQYPPLTYGDLPPIKLDVASIEIETAYKPNSEPPNVELLFPLRPDEAAASWGRDRLVAAGQSGRLRYIVREASATEEALETSTGVSGAFTTDQAERYKAVLGLEIEILSDQGQIIGTVGVNSSRTITMPEDSSIRDREQVWYDLTKKLMADANSQLEATINKTLTRFLVR